MKSKTLCTEVGCNKPKWSNDLCEGHWFQMKRRGFTSPLREKHDSCEVCGKAHYSKGFCKGHYMGLLTYILGDVRNSELYDTYIKDYKKLAKQRLKAKE